MTRRTPERTRDRKKQLEEAYLRQCRENFTVAMMRIRKDPDEIERLAAELYEHRLKRKPS